MRILLIALLIAVPVTALGQGSNHHNNTAAAAASASATGGSGGVGSVSVDGDESLGIGFPDPANRDPRFGEVAHECRVNPDGDLCELGKQVLYGRHNKVSLFVGKYICSWVPVFRNHC